MTTKRTKTVDVTFDGTTLSVVRLEDGGALGFVVLPDAEAAAAVVAVLSESKESEGNATHKKRTTTKKATPTQDESL